MDNNCKRTYYSRTWATILGSVRPPRKGTGDGPQEREWEWVYHPRSKGERRRGVRQTRLPSWHSAGEVSCEAETPREAEGHGDQEGQSLKKQKSPKTEVEGEETKPLKAYQRTAMDRQQLIPPMGRDVRGMWHTPTEGKR